MEYELQCLIINRIEEKYHVHYFNAIKYYLGKYSVPFKIPDNKHKDEELINISNDDFTKILLLLNIRVKQTYYFWLAKLYVILELPQGWAKQTNLLRQDQYTYKGIFNSYIKPSYLYVMKIKLFFERHKDKREQMQKLISLNYANFFHFSLNKRKRKLKYTNIKKLLYNEKPDKKDSLIESFIDGKSKANDHLNSLVLDDASSQQSNSFKKKEKSYFGKINSLMEEDISSESEQSVIFKWKNKKFLKEKSHVVMKKKLINLLGPRTKKHSKFPNFFLKKQYKRVSVNKENISHNQKNRQSDFKSKRKVKHNILLKTCYNRKDRHSVNLNKDKINILRKKLKIKGMDFSYHKLNKSLGTVEWKRKTNSLPKHGRMLIRLQGLAK